MTTARTLRLTLGALGVVTAGYGVYGLLNEHVITDRAAVGEWLVAGVIGHDFLLAPVVFILCAIAYRLTDARWRGRLAAFLLIGGSLVAISIPALIRQGRNRNTTVLPLDYARNLTVLLAILAAIMVVYGIADRSRRRRAARKALVAETPPEQQPEHQPRHPPEHPPEQQPRHEPEHPPEHQPDPRRTTPHDPPDA